MISRTGQTNRRAIFSLVLSLVSPVLVSPFFFPDPFGADVSSVTVPLAIIFSIAGAVVGRSALRRIKELGEPGRGIALAGVIIGWVFIVPLVLSVLFVLVVAGSWLLTPGW